MSPDEFYEFMDTDTPIDQILLGPRLNICICI